VATGIARVNNGVRASVVDDEQPDLPLRERAFAALKQRILEGHVPPGTVLTEARVARELGISRTPVREALARLTHEGLAQRFPGRGVIVLELGVRESIDVIEVQACLEQFAITRALESGREIDAAELQRLLTLQEAAIEEGDTRRFLELDRRMHLKIVVATDNGKLALIMQNASDLLTYVGYRALQDRTRMRETLGEHQALVAALAAGDLLGALAASQAHIDGAKRRLLG
jgi:DNA-binding GntR family transcriptional regulator